MLVIIAAVMSLFAGAADAQMGITFFPGPGMKAVPPACSPGNPTGQMDFSVCSNVAITAAVMP
jgi:hypothetical protein